MNIITAAWRLNRCTHPSTAEPFFQSKPHCWILHGLAFSVAVQQMNQAENKTPSQPMCLFMKSCLTGRMVASLTSHSKPKGKGCLKWPQRDLLVNLTFRTETFKIFHGLQQLNFFFWLFHAQLSSNPPLNCCPCAGCSREHNTHFLLQASQISQRYPVHFQKWKTLTEEKSKYFKTMIF